MSGCDWCSRISDHICDIRNEDPGEMLETMWLMHAYNVIVDIDHYVDYLNDYIKTGIKPDGYY